MAASHVYRTCLFRLEHSYSTAPMQEVNERLQTASETRRKINDACEEYRPVARRATLLYFLIAEFAGVNCMYQVGVRRGWGRGAL